MQVKVQNLCSMQMVTWSSAVCPKVGLNIFRLGLFPLREFLVITGGRNIVGTLPLTWHLR